METRSVYFEDLRKALSGDDPKWKFLDRKSVTLANGKEAIIRVHYTSPNVVCSFDDNGLKSRHYSLKELEKHLNGVRFSVEPDISNPEWSWLNDLPLSDYERHEAEIREAEAVTRKRQKEFADHQKHNERIREIEERKAKIAEGHAQLNRQLAPFIQKAQKEAEKRVSERREREQRAAEEKRAALIAKTEEWFDGPLPHPRAYDLPVLEVLSASIDASILPSEIQDRDLNDRSRYTADAVWWLRQAESEKSLFHLATSSSRWRSAGLSEVSVSITIEEVKVLKDHRPGIERVLTSHAAALCDVYVSRGRDHGALIDDAIEYNCRARNKNPKRAHPHMQLHRAYNLKGDAQRAVESLATAMRLQNVQQHSNERSFRIDPMKEIRKSYRENTDASWRSNYAAEIRNSVHAGDLSGLDINDVPF